MFTMQAVRAEAGFQNRHKEALQGGVIPERVRQRQADPWSSQVIQPSLNWQIPGQR